MRGGNCLNNGFLFSPSTVEAVGCFLDSMNNRAFPKMMANLRGGINWFNMNKTVQECANLAVKQGYKVRKALSGFYEPTGTRALKSKLPWQPDDVFAFHFSHSSLVFSFTENVGAERNQKFNMTNSVLTPMVAGKESEKLIETLSIKLYKSW